MNGKERTKLEVSLLQEIAMHRKGRTVEKGTEFYWSHVYALTILWRVLKKGK